MKQYPLTRLTTLAALLASCTVLGACGGGGGGDSETKSAAQAIVPSASSPADSAASAAAQSAAASAAVAQAPAEQTQPAAATASSAASSSTVVAATPATPSGTTAASTTGTTNTTGTNTAAAQVATVPVISGQVSTPATVSVPATEQSVVADSSAATSQIAATNKPTEQGSPSAGVLAPSKSEGSSPTDCALYSVRQFGTNSACYANAVGTVPNGSSLSFASSRAGYVGSTTASCSAGVVRWSAETCVRTTASATATLPAPLALPASPTQQTLALEGRKARLQSAIANMALDHEIVPAGVGTTVGWKYKADVGMNTEPYGNEIPSYWNGTRYAQWRGILTWFVIYPGEGGNPSTNSAVEINGMELWYLSIKDKIWRQIQSGALPVWHDAYAQNAISATASSFYTNISGSTMSFSPASNNMVHGGLAQASTPWNTATDLGDIDAIYAVVRHRLVLKNTADVDDRAQARLIVQVGVDYYPWVGAKMTDLGGASYVPAAGLSRFVQTTNNWRHSTLLLRSRRITEAQMLAVAPPSLIY